MRTILCLILLLILTSGLVFSQTRGLNPPQSIIIGMLLLLSLSLILIGIFIRGYLKKKKELAEIDAHLVNAESAITALNTLIAREELNKVNTRIKTSDEKRRKKLLELLTRLEILDNNIRFDICAERMESAISIGDFSVAHSEWKKIKDINVIDDVRKAERKKLSLRLKTLKTSIELDTHLKKTQSALNSKKAVTAHAELDIVRRLLKKVSDTKHNKKLKDLTLQLETLEEQIKNENAKQLKMVRKDIGSGYFIDIESIKNNVLHTISKETPKEVQNEVKVFINEFEEQYKKGIIPDQTLEYVQYNASKLRTPNKDGYYCHTLFPSQNTILFPYRRKKVERRGYTENAFQRALSNCIDEFPNLMALGDVSILTKSGTHPYEPDIAIVEKNYEKGFRIDIEIDEPYTGIESKPIHFIGCGDNYRDQVMINHGWIVVRFSEKQIYKESSKCIAYIKYLISSIFKLDYTHYEYPTYDKKWTENEARILIVQKYRENLLNHEFAQVETEPLNKIDITQTELERQASPKVKQVTYNTTVPRNLNDSHDEYNRDNLLSFDPAEHIYLYEGREFAAVSTIVSKFFREFNPIDNSMRVASREGVSQIEIMERWDAAGKESRDIGTFMHAQIERVLHHENPFLMKHFEYTGQYININTDISIKTELKYFQEFMKDNKIYPYRSEWRIYDEVHEIAGTIDLVCQNGQNYEIYDWKRSRKAQPDETIWAYGKNGLEHIPDISFYHYALQQNLYKYILEKNYGIHVSKMHIVIFHPNYDSYKLYEIPHMNKEIQLVLSKI